MQLEEAVERAWYNAGIRQGPLQCVGLSARSGALNKGIQWGPRGVIKHLASQLGEHLNGEFPTSTGTLQTNFSSARQFF